MAWLTTVLISCLILLGCSDGAEDNLPSDADVSQVSGVLEGDIRWSAVNSPYHVLDTVTIPRGSQLRIEPGVTVEFAADAALVVEGVLLVGAEAPPVEAANMVRFTSAGAFKDIGSWAGIQFSNAEEQVSQLRGAIVEYARIAIDVTSSVVGVFDSIVRNNDTGVLLFDSQATIAYCQIEDNTTGIKVVSPRLKPELKKNNITGNEIGMLLKEIHTVISENNLAGNLGFAVRLEYERDVLMPNNWWGATVAEEIDLSIADGKDGLVLANGLLAGTVLLHPFYSVPVADAGVRTQ